MLSRFLINTPVITGWLMFIACLFLPATTENNMSQSGFTYAVLSIDHVENLFSGHAWSIIALSGISNVLAVLAFVFVFISSVRLLIVLALIFLLFGINNAWYYLLGIPELDIGYFVWVASFFTLSAGLMIKATRNE